MESPHEHQQNQLLFRIIKNVEKLNESIQVLNKMLEETSDKNANPDIVAQMWKNYHSNVQFNLEVTNSLQDPK
ncbi:DASH complex subunit Dad4 [Pyronema omphalodes]|nr:DASH complex subunit Dad4 [Pyronema omphalodes]